MFIELTRDLLIGVRILCSGSVVEVPDDRGQQLLDRKHANRDVPHADPPLVDPHPPLVPAVAIPDPAPPADPPARPQRRRSRAKSKAKSKS